MLPHPERLRRARDFALLSQKGRPVFEAFFTLRFRATQTPTKFGIVASAKIFKTAVERNRVKRRMREALRDTRVSWPEHVDGLFVMKREAMTIEFARLREALVHAYSKIPFALTQPIRPKKMKARRATSVIYKETTA